MSKLILPVIISLLVVWLVGATFWFDKKYNQYDSLEGAECTEILRVVDGDFQTKSENTIIFELSNWEPTIPMQALASLKSIALYLVNSNEKSLTLTGWFGLNEVNNSDFENNGIARAEAIKNELVAYGAPADRIYTEATSFETIELKCGKILGAMDFSFGTKKNTTQQSESKPIAKANDSSTSSRNVDTSTKVIFDEKKTYMVFYDENTFKPEVNEELDSYFKSLSKYLDENPKDRLLLMGHTDSVGDKDKHFNFGKYRARKLRDVLLTYDIAKRRIKTDSEGSSKPLDSNRTSEGRYQNRRVEISIIHR